MGIEDVVFGPWNILYSGNPLRQFYAIGAGENLLLSDPEMSLIKKVCPNNSIVVLKFCVVSLCSCGLNLDFGPVQEWEWTQSYSKFLGLL